MDDSETGRQAAAGLAALRSELSAIRALLADRDAQLAERDAQFNDLAGRLADRDAQLAEQDRRLAGQAERIRELEDEIRRLKKLPRRPDLKPKGSGASDGDADGSSPGSSGSGRSEKEKRKRGRGPRRRNPNLRRREETVSLGNVPEGAVRRGYQDHMVRDIVSCAEEVVYRREVWEFPDGSRHVAPLPPGAAAGRERHGPCVKALAIMPCHQCQSTAGRIAEMPAAIGLDVSERRAGRFPTADAGGIAGEQQEVLRAGLETAAWISADDTGARHKAGNGYCTAIGNDFFARFRSTGSKSRLDFLERPCAGEEDCTVNDAALECMRKRNLSGRAVALLAGHERRRFGGGDGWRARPEALGIAGMTVSPDPAKIATEGALWGTVRDAGRIAGTVIPVDDAGQFNVGDLHALCRLHAERNIARPTGSAPCQHERVDKVLDKVWKLYRSLCRYRKRPTPLRKLVMQRRFDRIFGTAAGCASLDRLLERLAANRDELLRVPGRPETPLNANRAGNDIRDHAARRKVSFGTRSDAGRTARDACIGAKKTCRKLGVPCRDCLRSRLGVAGAPDVPRLADLVRQRAAA